MNKNGLIFLFLVSFCYPLPAQNIETWVASQKSILYEKVYLHVDREFYSPDDIIWFKAYLVSGISNTLLPGYKNIFIQLISNEGKVVANRILLSQNGITHGDILITDSLADGPYTLRAFTKYLENFGEESCFHKKIWISRARGSPVDEIENQENIPDIEVAFFPESGDLVLNSSNYVAVKATGKSGKGIQINGKIVDERDSMVTTFSTGFSGLGRLLFMPQEGKQYRAKINGHPEFQYPITQILENGFTLNFQDKGENVLFTMTRNIKKTDLRNLYLVASHKGIVLFYKNIGFGSFIQALKVGKSQFPPGISKISLLDEGFNIVAERLIFTEDDPMKAKLSMDKNQFSTREKAEVNVQMLLDPGDTIQSTMSVSVVNNDYFSSHGNNLTISSYLLLDSELKGAIESPASYFTDSEGITSTEKLNLLMMVQGWRSYYWNDLNRYSQDQLTGWDNAGITVEGTVKALLRERPVIGGEVVLGPFSRNLLFEETKTDSLGRFRFDRLYLKDSARIMINAKNEKDRANTEIIPDPVLSFPTKISVPEIQKTVKEINLPLKFYRENYNRQQKLAEFIPEKGDILLDEVTVMGRHKEKEDGHFRIYGEPDNVLKIKEDDYTYENILDYLDNKVAGIVISGESISIRGGKTPLFLLDGIKVESEMVGDLIFHAHMSDIDKIEIIKSGSGMAAFGSQGADGVIAVYTKKGDISREYNRYVKGRIIITVNGFKPPAQFYSPRYTPETIRDPRPDYRPTLYWEPEISLKNGKADIEFYTSDELAYYTVILEGISRKGKICHATATFRVTSFNNR
jgi:hypothetical protein